MFSGIIEIVGKVGEISSTKLSIRFALEKKEENFNLGESVSVNGVCLTLVHFSKFGLQYTLYFDVSVETYRKTNFGNLKPGDKVNIERSLRVGDRIGGHFITGHVEATGEINKIKKEKNSIILEISATNEILKYVIPKGSIAVEGISLTVVDLLPAGFTISLVPHTMKLTNLAEKKAGDKINLEPDIFSKYIVGPSPIRALSGKVNNSKITMEFLKDKGFL